MYSRQNCIEDKEAEKTIFASPKKMLLPKVSAPDGTRTEYAAQSGCYLVDQL